MVENGRHREAAEIVLATIPSANAVLATALLGIAEALDKCEIGVYDARLFAGLIVQLFQCLDRLGVEADNDIWEQLSKELQK
jgi:hypothetical protein